MEDTPNQILHMLSTLILWSKSFYDTIGKYPTLYNFSAITQDELILWEHHLDNPSMCAKLNIFQPTLLPAPLYSGEMLHHNMHDSGESPDGSVCHTVSTTTSPSVCKSYDSSVCQLKSDSTWNSICQSVCPLSFLSVQPSVKFMVKIPLSIAGQNFQNVQNQGKFLSICTSSDSSVNHSGSPSVTLSPSAEYLSEFHGNNGEKKLPA